MPQYPCDLWSEIHRIIILDTELSHVKNVSISITSKKVGGVETAYLVIKDTRKTKNGIDEELELENVKIPPETGERLFGKFISETLVEWRKKLKPKRKP
ncbi:MAG: hypothetical protein JWQ09_203 [Segetibacter sp.]|nr:hypothetical protein [Segetibacter sp.]